VAHLRILACLALLAYPHLTRSSDAAPIRFDFKDPKAVNTVVVTLDSLLEPVAGVASGVSGEVQFDPENPKAATGQIVVETASLRFVNDRYTQTALSERGLDATAHPTITFALKRVRDVRRSGTSGYVGSVDADFTCHGVTKSLTAPLRAAYLAGKARDRNRRGDGDLLVLRTTFTIKRSDFQIATGPASELLAEDVEIRAAIVGVSGEAASIPLQPASSPAQHPLPVRFALGESVADVELASVRDGQKVSLLSDRSQKATVALFLSASCPVSGAYDERLRKLGEEFGRRGVRFVAINASAAETTAEAAEHLVRARLPFPMVKDPGNVVADRFQASVTPEAFLIDGHGVLRYRGRIDDSQDAARVRSRDLRDALEAVLAGRQPPRSEAKAFGCLIDRVKGG
jgi:polyisoprenoid-binding protein YceI/peroxiredoxin